MMVTDPYQPRLEPYESFCTAIMPADRMPGPCTRKVKIANMRVPCFRVLQMSILQHAGKGGTWIALLRMSMMSPDIYPTVPERKHQQLDLQRRHLVAPGSFWFHQSKALKPQRRLFTRLGRSARACGSRPLPDALDYNPKLSIH